MILLFCSAVYYYCYCQSSVFCRVENWYNILILAFVFHILRGTFLQQLANMTVLMFLLYAFRSAILCHFYLQLLLHHFFQCFSKNDNHFMLVKKISSFLILCILTIFTHILHLIHHSIHRFDSSFDSSFHFFILFFSLTIILNSS